MSRQPPTAAHIEVKFLRTPALLVSLLSGAALAGDFKVQRTEGDGLVLESRSLAETDFPEIRVRTHVLASPSSLAESVWTFRRNGVEGKLVEKRLVLQETANSRLVWQVVHAPVVSARESLIRYSRGRESDGAFVVKFHSESGAAPEHVDNTVRVGLVRGSWKFAPDGEGGTYVEHVCVSEPGGGIPPWLARGAQEDIALNLVREVVALALRTR